VVCLEPARTVLFPVTPRSFCARELSLNFAAHKRRMAKI
jgi:hypothetical protein